MKIGEMYNAEMLAKICRAGEIKLEELIKDCNAVKRYSSANIFCFSANAIRLTSFVAIKDPGPEGHRSTFKTYLGKSPQMQGDS